MKNNQEGTKSNRLLEEWDSLKRLAFLALAICSISVVTFMMGDLFKTLTGVSVYGFFALTLVTGILVAYVFLVTKLGSIKWTKPVTIFVFLTGTPWVFFGKCYFRPIFSLFRLNEIFPQESFRLRVIEGWKFWLFLDGIIVFIIAVVAFPQLAFIGVALAFLFALYALTVALQIKHRKLRPEHIRAQTITEVLKCEREKSSQKI